MMANHPLYLVSFGLSSRDSSIQEVMVTTHVSTQVPFCTSLSNIDSSFFKVILAFSFSSEILRNSFFKMSVEIYKEREYAQQVIRQTT